MALARRVIAAWDVVVLQTKPLDEPLFRGTDGQVNHFGSRLKYGVVTGQIHFAGAAVESLVAVVDRLQSE